MCELKLTNKSAKKIQLTLHKDYHSSEIKVIRSYFIGIYYMLIEAIFHADDFIDAKELINRVLIKRNSQGVYSPNNKVSYVFAFNIKFENKVDCEMCGVWTLIHELRHHYQHTKKPKLSRIAEKDTERFAFRLIDRNYNVYIELLK